ncbi:vWA domain-containing protein [Vulgatibacter incomptus]|uniref:CglB n=1 Tax=Vulgatibacter incomptus TaxID=1391653 RepID=A0A0K1PFP1_9BACT|nr:vWA domain-containing protein [Vulgatibacter incomptus]AKU91934.1 CglB [Vulgatibacter incomptus]
MRALRLGMSAVMISGFGIAACQAYNMEGVDPQTVIAVETYGKFEQTKAPTLLIVQDRSGSMKACFDPLNTPPGSVATSGGCELDDGSTDKNRRTRMEVAQQVMTKVVGRTRDEVRFGLIAYGVGASSCGDPIVLAEPASNGYQAVGAAYMEAPSLNKPAGGTPTTQALRMAYDRLVAEKASDVDPQTGEPNDRKRYVVLVTDGLMNCNTQHTTPCVCASETGCFAPGGTVPYGSTGTFAAEQCLDDSNSYDEIDRLHAAGFDTFVIGLGDVFGGQSVLATEVLDELAVRGGVPQEGGANKFYSAGDETQLQESLEKIISQISAPCEYDLDGPVCDGRLVKIALKINGEVVETSCNQTAGDATWFFADKPGGGLDEKRIVFSPSICARLSDAKGVEISIRGVENGCDAGAAGPACSLEGP